MQHPPARSGQHNQPKQTRHDGQNRQDQQDAQHGQLHPYEQPRRQGEQTHHSLTTEAAHQSPLAEAASLFSLAPLEPDHCADICEWTYPPPYDLYSWKPWDQMAAEQTEFGDPTIRALQYAAVLDGTGKLAGFAQFFPLLGVTRLGLGMAPTLCGQARGIGVAFVQAIVAEAQRRAPADEIDLEVLTWNKRAQIVYERAGFHITDTYTRATPTGEAEFHCMVYNPDR